MRVGRYKQEQGVHRSGSYACCGDAKERRYSVLAGLVESRRIIAYDGALAESFKDGAQS